MPITASDSTGWYPGLRTRCVSRRTCYSPSIPCFAKLWNEATSIRSISTLEQLESLPHTMIRKYCILVNNYSRRAYSSLIQTCMDYIDFHYSTDLSLSSLASMCSVSSSYLSSLFKKEVGMTITDYIHYTRIRQSLTMLNASSLSVSEIAALCGFSDANYFTRTFKKLQGKTPKAYREEMGIG